MRPASLMLASALAVLALSHCAAPPRVGSACARDADCSGGDAAVCLTGDGLYAGGYCSRFCDRDSDCGAAAFCELGTGNGLCVAGCLTSADCRSGEGYACVQPDADAGRSACLPTFPSDGG